MLLLDLQALKAQFVNNWSGSVVTLFDNQPNENPPKNGIWVRYGVRAGASTHYAGSAIDGEMKQLGRVWLQIFVPHRMGEGPGLALADTFATIFRNKRLDSGKIHCETEEINVIPEQAGFYMITVSIPWTSYRRYTG